MPFLQSLHWLHMYISYDTLRSECLKVIFGMHLCYHMLLNATSLAFYADLETGTVIDSTAFPTLTIDFF
jgi:hypothetical protein